MDFRALAPHGAQTLACAMPVHTPGSGSDGVTVSPSPEAMAMSLIGPSLTSKIELRSLFTTGALAWSGC